jgi:hypothetical protein
VQTAFGAGAPWLRPLSAAVVVPHRDGRDKFSSRYPQKSAEETEFVGRENICEDLTMKLLASKEALEEVQKGFSTGAFANFPPLFFLATILQC